jgi:hypothetical protein
MSRLERAGYMHCNASEVQSELTLSCSPAGYGEIEKLLSPTQGLQHHTNETCRVEYGQLRHLQVQYKASAITQGSARTNRRAESSNVTGNT